MEVYPERPKGQGEINETLGAGIVVIRPDRPSGEHHFREGSRMTAAGFVGVISPRCVTQTRQRFVYFRMAFGRILADVRPTGQGW